MNIFFKKPISIIPIISLVLFVLWFIKSLDYEPAIGIIVSLGTFFGILIKNKKNMTSTNRLIYSIQIRGYNEDELLIFIKNLTEKYFELSGYKYEMLDGDWYTVIFETKSKIKHDELYMTCLDITKNDGVKVYEVEGEGKIFGLLLGEGPAQYL